MTHTLLKERMNIVVVGHVDHGKSTMVGRLLVDTGSLPEGKLEQVKATCERHSKPFEYAFMLDALKDEQSQGITIDSARCFFTSKKRDYIIIDAPGHIEFLKNMISGAARAEAAILIIDADEGIKENSRRHGYMLSMLGIKQVVVAVNKMDLVSYDEKIFNAIEKEFRKFLLHVNITPKTFVPISAREGDNIVTASKSTPWYSGKSILDEMDDFGKEKSDEDKPFRFPIQDIYKFTAHEDDRRIIAGRIESGTVQVGDEVVFLPSGKKSVISSIEGFNTPDQTKAVCGQSTGFTLKEQIYIRPGEVMCKTNDMPTKVCSQLRVNLFWMAPQPFIKNKRYKLKLATTQIPVWLDEINTVIDASELSTVTKRVQVNRHDVAECVLQTFKPIALDLSSDISATGRFVIVDNYEIAGGGIVIEAMGTDSKLLKQHIELREKYWERSIITPGIRAGRYGQRSTFVVVVGNVDTGKLRIAKALEVNLFNKGRFAYYLGISNTFLGIDSDLKDSGERAEFLRRLGEVSHLFTDAGTILITTISDADDYELEMLRNLNAPNDMLVVNVGENNFSKFDLDLQLPANIDTREAIEKITSLLQSRNVLMEYYL